MYSAAPRHKFRLTRRAFRRGLPLEHRADLGFVCLTDLDKIRKSRETGCSLRGEKHCSVTHGATGLTAPPGAGRERSRTVHAYR
eukprot:5981426-Prymnesium_polylepis.1